MKRHIGFRTNTRKIRSDRVFDIAPAMALSHGMVLVGVSDALARRMICRLDEPERSVAHSFFVERVRCKAIARLTGTATGTVGRRLKSIRKRLERPQAQAVILMGDKLPEHVQDFAVDVYVRGIAVTRAARERGMHVCRGVALLAMIDIFILCGRDRDTVGRYVERFFRNHEGDTWR